MGDMKRRNKRDRQEEVKVEWMPLEELSNITPTTMRTTTTMTADNANYGTMIGLGGKILRYKKSGVGGQVVELLVDSSKEASSETTVHNQHAVAAAATTT